MFPLNIFTLGLHVIEIHLGPPILFRKKKEWEIRIVSESLDTHMGYNTTYQHMTECQITLWTI